MSGRIILTAEEMRAAEGRAIAAGAPVETLMERAGAAAAETIRRFAGPMPALVLCGPGNNGGDGYVIARRLQERGFEIRVAALGEPRSAGAATARRSWGGEAEELESARPAPLLVDALFGTGLARPLDEAAAGALARLARAARLRIAIDLPSGVATDDGSLLSPVPDFDLTITFQTLKPSHLLQPAARHMGRIVAADIGIAARSDLSAIGRPVLAAPGPEYHKYSRGYVAIVAGAMPGAAALSAEAALGAGAGYVRLVAPEPQPGLPHAIVQENADCEALLADGRIGALVVGPGLGRDGEARRLLGLARVSGRPLVLDGDALRLLGEAPARLERALLTPHEGEFRSLFPSLTGSKVERARSAAAASGAVVVYKGADTVVAAPDGRAAIAPPGPHWLASAGTGDVLAGVAAAMRARGLAPFEAACAGVWLHGRAAEIAGPALIADDLARALRAAVAECA